MFKDLFIKELHTLWGRYLKTVHFLYCVYQINFVCFLTPCILYQCSVASSVLWCLNISVDKIWKNRFRHLYCWHLRHEKEWASSVWNVKLAVPRRPKFPIYWSRIHCVAETVSGLKMLWNVDGIGSHDSGIAFPQTASGLAVRNNHISHFQQ